MNHNVTKSNGVMSPRCYLFYQFFGCRVCRLTRLVGSNEHGLHEKLKNRLFRRSLLKNLTGSILLRLAVQQHYAPVLKRGEQGRNRDFECQQSSDSCIGDQPSIQLDIIAQHRCWFFLGQVIPIRNMNTIVVAAQFDIIQTACRKEGLKCIIIDVRNIII